VGAEERGGVRALRSSEAARPSVTVGAGGDVGAGGPRSIFRGGGSVPFTTAICDCCTSHCSLLGDVRVPLAPPPITTTGSVPNRQGGGGGRLEVGVVGERSDLAGEGRGGAGCG
jgi:hypothetical protein